MTIRFDASGKVDREYWLISDSHLVREQRLDLADALDECVAEMQNILKAKRFDRKYFDDDAAFIDWAQSRLSHTIRKI